MAEPKLASAWHLSAGSPCRGAGNAASATEVDIDGESWASPPAIGCDEYRAGALTGPLSLAILATYTNVAMGFTVDFTAAIDGHCSASRWEFGDGVVVSNRPYASHSWVAAGDYPVVLRAYNESYPGGVTATVMVHVALQPVHYVALTSPHPVAPYTVLGHGGDDPPGCGGCGLSRGDDIGEQRGLPGRRPCGVWDADQSGGGDQAGDPAQPQRAGGDGHRGVPRD